MNKSSTCIILSALMAAGIFFACTGDKQNGNTPAPTNSADVIVTPPARIGEVNDAIVQYDKVYSFTSAYEASDVVCVITIGNWLEENVDQEVTYYEATVDKVIKGDIPEKIIFTQYGTSKQTDRRYIMLTYGNKLLVFLSHHTEHYKYENEYGAVGDPITMCHVIKDANGVEYAVDFDGYLSLQESYQETAFAPEKVDPEKIDELRDVFYAADPFWQNYRDVFTITSGRTYKLSNIEAYYKTLSGK